VRGEEVEKGMKYKKKCVSKTKSMLEMTHNLDETSSWRVCEARNWFRGCHKHSKRRCKLRKDDSCDLGRNKDAGKMNQVMALNILLILKRTVVAHILS
jgi:hypothetical protein